MNFSAKKLLKILASTTLFAVLLQLVTLSLSIPTVHAAGEAIQGTVFFDTDHDGVQDITESGIQGVNVFLYDNGDQNLGFVTTDLSGNYQIDTGASGDFYITFENYPGIYTFSPQDQGADNTVDSDVLDGQNRTGTINVADSTQVTNVDAGMYIPTATVGDLVFDDIDQDGTQSVGDTGIPLVTVNVIDMNSNSQVGTDTSAGDGSFSVPVNISGCVGPNLTWNDTAETDTYNCSANVTGGAYYLIFSTTMECDMPGSDFTLSLLNASNDEVYSGSCIAMPQPDKLMGGTDYIVGPFVESTTGSATLNFTNTAPVSEGFTNIFLFYSSYQIEVPSAPSGYTFTTQYAGMDGGADSDVNGLGYSDSFILFPGYDSPEHDVGMYESGVSTADLSLAIEASSTSGNVTDHVSVTLSISNNGPDTATNVTASYPVSASELNLHSTSGSGSYNIMDGQWSISSIPAGETAQLFFDIEFANVGNTTTTAEITNADSIDPNSTFNDQIDQDDYKLLAFNISGGGGGAATCEPEDTCIGGGVFLDANNNGIIDEEEAGAGGIQVELRLSSSSDLVASTTTSGGGEYIFSSGSSDVQDGVEYYLVFEKPDGYNFSPQDQGEDDTIDSDVDESGFTAVFTLSAQEHKDNLFAGLANASGEGDGGGDGGGDGDCGSDTCGQVLLHFFTDTNGNGSQDNDEPDGAPGTTIHIESDEGAFDTEPDEYTGDVEGTLSVGEYTFTITPPDGTTVTGGNSIIVLSIEEDETTNLGSRGIYAGETGRVTLHIFTDTNNDGDQDSGEADGVNDTTLHILNTDDESEQDVDFDENGDLDTHLIPGNYTFTIIIPSGATVTGTTEPLNPITDVVISADETTDLGTRGVYTASSNGGGGGGGSSGNSRGSTRHVNWGSLGRSNDDGGSSWVSGSVPNRSHNNSTSQSSNENPLPPVVPTYTPCLISGGTSARSFSDTHSNPDLDFLTGLTFVDEPGQALITGYGDNSFRPNNYLTRYELLKIALSSNCAGSASSLTQQNQRFSDIPQDDSEQSRIVAKAFALGIINGSGDQFFPNQPVSYGEMVKILFNASAYFKDGKPIAELNTETPGVTDQSFVQAIAYAQTLGILPFGNDENFPQNQLVTRGDMATTLANFIRIMSGTVLVN